MKWKGNLKNVNHIISVKGSQCDSLFGTCIDFIVNYTERNFLVYVRHPNYTECESKCISDERTSKRHRWKNWYNCTIFGIIRFGVVRYSKNLVLIQFLIFLWD